MPTARKTIDLALADLPKLPPGLQAQTLALAGTLYRYDPDPDLAKAKELYLQLVKLRPDDFQAWNNLASNKLIKPEESVQYSQKAYDAMQKANVVDPNVTAYVKDTHGWNLVQVGRLDEGLGILLEAWQSLQFPDLAYHLAVTFLKQNKPDEAEKYLAQANELFGKYLEQRQVTDMKLQDDINAAMKQAKDLKAKLSNSQ